MYIHIYVYVYLHIGCTFIYNRMCGRSPFGTHESIGEGFISEQVSGKYLFK